MRLLFVLVTTLSVIALTACADLSDDSDQHTRHQAGPYIGGSAGAAF